MQSTSSVVFFLISIIFVLNIEAFIFSAPPVVEESEIQEPPSYIRLRRAGTEKLDSCYSWEIRQKCALTQDATTCVIDQCNRCAILRPGWIPQSKTLPTPTNH
uniref:Secreted protein n=1 Tax=Acrobeloides nanus TaxID=290746 RepID=A0A914DJ64_9BILA